MTIPFSTSSAGPLKCHSSVSSFARCTNCFSKITFLGPRPNRPADLSNMARSPRNTPILGWGDSLFEALDFRF